MWGQLALGGLGLLGQLWGASQVKTPENEFQDPELRRRRMEMLDMLQSGGGHFNLGEMQKRNMGNTTQFARQHGMKMGSAPVMNMFNAGNAQALSQSMMGRQTAMNQILGMNNPTYQQPQNNAMANLAMGAGNTLMSGAGLSYADEKGWLR
jgi:hypothetical protein